MNINEKILKFKNFILSKVGIAIIALLCGICGTIVAETIIKNNHQKKENDLFNFEKIILDWHNSSLNFFDKIRDDVNKTFYQSSQLNNDASTEVIVDKKDKFYKYELTFSGYQKEDIVVEIKNNILAFYGKKSDKKENQKEQSYINKSFGYSFYVPSPYNNQNPKILREDQKITVIFELNK